MGRNPKKLATIGNYRGSEVKKLIRITMLLITGLLVSTNVSAYYLDGSDIRSSIAPNDIADGDYLGSIGNVHDGLPAEVRGIGNPNWIGSDYIYSNNYGLGPSVYISYTSNDKDSFNSDGSNTVHWYQFSSNQESPLNAFYELGTDISSFAISFYIDGGDSDDAIFSKIFSAAELSAASSLHLYDYGFTNVPAGDLLIKIEGNADGTTNLGYKVQLYTTAVPLPPAVVLFISALAGFGVIGRKKARNA